MAEIDDRIRACFPHATFRPGQFEFIKEAIQAFEGGAKNVIVEAPTGTGKTPGIITIARYFTLGFEKLFKEAQQAMLMAQNEREGVAKAQEILGPVQAHMITSMKMLQDQYLKDDKLVLIMKGKGNYMCHSPSAPPGSTCSDHEAMFGNTCAKKTRPCVYVKARTAAQMSRLTLHNFDSFLNQVSLGGSFVPRAILTVDEAHNTDHHLIALLRFELGREHFERLEIEGWHGPDSISDPNVVMQWLKDADSRLLAQATRLAAEVERLKTKPTLRTSEEDRQLARMGRQTGAVADLRRRIGRYLNSAEKVPWAVESTDDGAITFEPVRSAPFAKTALLDYGHRRLFMSATIFDKGRRLMSAINLKKDETHYISVRCIFPVENRPLVNLAVADTGQKWYAMNRKQMISSICEILERHQGERGVIHCNSYSMAKDIRDSIRDPRLIFHEAKTRQEVVDKFMTGSRKDSVLVGVFLREGYDFRDDLARFQVLVRLPYAYPDKRTSMRDEMEKGYYDWLCAIDLVQTYGRGVRNERDHCVTYCLDNRLGKFLKRAGYMMPEWFLEAVKTPEELGIPRARMVEPGSELAPKIDDSDIFNIE